MKMIFIIKDWVGNRIFPTLTFSTYEEASDFLLYQFPNDEDLQEYYIHIK
jgi:hypothetical protein